MARSSRLRSTPSSSAIRLFSLGRKLKTQKWLQFIVSDVFGHLVVGLRGIDDTVFSVPAINEKVDDTVLVAFTNQVIKDDDFLVFYRKLFKLKDVITKGFDDLITNAWVNTCGKVLQESLILVLVEVFREEINFVKLQQLVKHEQQDVCFSKIARPADQYPENISRHAGISLLVVVCGRKFGIVIQNFHFLIYYTPIIMSMKKWHQRAEEKGELAEQERQIRQKFKMKKINKQFRQISGDELFKPITKRLDKAATKDTEPEPAEELDYGQTQPVC